MHDRSSEPSTAPQPTNYRALVFATALCCLMFELVLARLVDFHLGADNAYLALPIAFLGLALGSLHVHLVPGSIERFSLRRALAVLVGLCVGGLLFAFLFFSWVMPVTATNATVGQLSYLAKKTAIFVVVMLLPFHSFGRILTSIYQLRRDDIGSIYAADLLGAALACAMTPVAFHFGGLPTVIVVLIVLSFVPLVLSLDTSRARLIAVVATLVFAVGAERLVAWADGSVDYARFEGIGATVEIAHGWNEHSRVAVVEVTSSKGKKSHTIIHNNSRSAVRVWRYKPTREPAQPKAFEGREAPWVLGREPTNILVMFAGTGAEMISIDRFTAGDTPITGVELNGLVEQLGRETPALKKHRIAEFLDKDHIELVIDEGRHFLTTRPPGTKYDLIYMGSNAATTAVTGHTTKYLDTVEAYETYLDLLAPGGLIVFDHQPLNKRISNMRHVFERRGIANFQDKVIIVDSRHSNDDMIIAPDGFTQAELDRAIEFVNTHHAKRSRQIRYLPRQGYKRTAAYRELIEGEATGDVFTDDRPFMRDLDLPNYKLIPTAEQRESLSWYVTWIKVTTVVVLSMIAVVFIGVASLRRESRAPAPVLLYLVLTGFCFMLCEVAIMAKLELFLTQPLLSMAAVLSLFLLTSGIGSAIYPRLARLHDTRVLAGLAAAAVVLVTLVLDAMVGNLLHLPVALKLVLATMAIAPLGVVLGLFYPHLVSCLIDQDRAQTVSISYGLSTLSSVVGSAYALAAMIDLGFDRLLHQAALGYVALFVFAVGYALAGGRWLRRAD
ncbi:hypothetical protein [Enhygromyxa salina]|uniref:hypothetical protein n=1 Tax=Enhygromyxa salina TaxID=215803 RepID=UPI0004E75BAF|nr:hypothetical protein [Enhygromyxa salina]